ncbi:glycosyltransferase [Spirosoma harenae]
MSKTLFLSIPSHGHMNPMLGLAAELANQGEEIIFLSSEEFKNTINDIGAHFVAYKEDMNIFQKKPGDAKPKGGLVSALLQPQKFVDNVLLQIQDYKVDYIVFSAAYPYATVIAQYLNIPAVSSFAVFVPLKELFAKPNQGLSVASKGPFGVDSMVLDELKLIRQQLIEKYNVTLPENVVDLLFNKGDLNIIYTSKYFIRNLDDYDDSFLFIGPPVYKKPYDVAFPFDKLEGKKVIYISLGTVFGNHSATLNQLFFDSFADTDFVVVMAAHHVDVSEFKIPDNFIIRDYVPQLELLTYTTVAITHAGMNSIGDLLYNTIPFVSIPLGADQFYLANRAAELGATIVLDANTLTAEQIKQAVDSVLTDPTYLGNIRKISQSFMEAGGYEKAAAEILKLAQKASVSI